MINNGKQQSTFLFHDYETLGMRPALDRPAQFAVIRTDSEFNIIGEPEVFYCRSADDYLPQPGVILITGVTPQEARVKGENEAAFAARVHSPFIVPKTCIPDYNNTRFDGEVIRNVFYRSSYDPYAQNWQHDNSCWGLLNVTYACYALRPEGINWPENDDGLPSFHPKHSTKANGTEHNNAHDVMADVYATITMAKLVKTRQPRLFDYLLTHRNKHKLMASIDVSQMKPLVHVSGVFGAWCGNTNWVIPLAWYPEDHNAVIMVNLTRDISPLLKLDSDTLRERLYTAEVDLGNNAAIPAKLVHINKCLVLAQADTLCPEDTDRLRINRQHYLDNLEILRKNPQVRERIVAIFAEARPFTSSENVDAQLYNGFFSDADCAAMRTVLKIGPRNLPALDITFVDKRIGKLLFNYRACNLPEMLDYAEQQRWLEYRRQVFMLEPLQSYVDELQTLTQQYAGDKEEVALLEVL